MIDLPEMRRLWRIKRVDFWIAVLAIVGVLSAGVLAGVIIGIALSLAWLLYVNAVPAMSELGRERGTRAFRPIDEYPHDEVYEGLLVVRFDGGLTFATAEGLADGIEARVMEAVPPVTGIVIDFSGVNFIDSQGADELRRLLDFAEREGSSLRFCRLRAVVLDVLRADGLVERIGEDHLHTNPNEAVNTELSERRPQ
jgi:anti-anti-sigma factor